MLSYICRWLCVFTHACFFIVAKRPQEAWMSVFQFIRYYSAVRSRLTGGCSPGAAGVMNERAAELVHTPPVVWRYTGWLFNALTGPELRVTFTEGDKHGLGRPPPLHMSSTAPTAGNRYLLYGNRCSPHLTSLNTRRVDVNNFPFKRPTIVDVSALSEQQALSLAAVLPDHRLETTPSRRWLVRRWRVRCWIHRLISGRGFYKGGTGRCDALRRGGKLLLSGFRGHRWSRTGCSDRRMCNVYGLYHTDLSRGKEPLNAHIHLTF